MKREIVSRIEDGIVIDHVSPGKGLRIVSVLREKIEGHPMVLLQNADSSKMGKKDIIKIEGLELDEDDVQMVALFSPDATINLIKDEEVVKKEKAECPEVVEGIIRCPNAKCITNDPRERKFLDSRMLARGNQYICDYCDAGLSFKDLSKHVGDTDL